MSAPLAVLVAAAGWIFLVLGFRWLGARWLSYGPRAEPVTTLMWLWFRAICRLMHRTTYGGREHLPQTNRPGGLVVVSNHTGPVDPLLIQSACRFEIRWMMASDMMVPQLNWLWRRQRIIAVARDGRDSAPAREAIRHVRGGGVIGIFPEGGIVQPRGEVRAFHNGVGLIVAKSRAPVLLVWVSQTPESPEMLTALFTPSRSRVEFIDVIRFDRKTDPQTITRTLQQRVSEASGWPVNDVPVVSPRVNPDPFAA